MAGGEGEEVGQAIRSLGAGKAVAWHQGLSPEPPVCQSWQQVLGRIRKPPVSCSPARLRVPFTPGCYQLVNPVSFLKEPDSFKKE